MSVFESIMRGLNEAVEYQQGKINARRTKVTITFEDINDPRKYSANTVGTVCEVAEPRAVYGK